MSDETDNQFINELLHGKQERELAFLQSVGIVPREPVDGPREGSFDGGAREPAPPLEVTVEEVERDHADLLQQFISELRSA